MKHGHMVFFTIKKSQTKYYYIVQDNFVLLVSAAFKSYLQKFP